MSLPQRCAFALVMVAAAACGAFRHRVGDARPDPIVIFNNQSMDQADVYAVGSAGQPVRIGTVYSGRRENLRVPSGATGGSGTVNIIARIFASNKAPRSGSISLAPGDTVLITLPVDEKMLTVLPAP
jgi:hypothetical protein